MPWEHCFDVPGQEAIDESIYKHHDDDVHHGEVVACHGAVPDVVPLYPHCLLLKLGNLKAAKAKGNAGGQALVEKKNNGYKQQRDLFTKLGRSCEQND